MAVTADNRSGANAGSPRRELRLRPALMTVRMGKASPDRVIAYLRKCREELEDPLGVLFTDTPRPVVKRTEPRGVPERQRRASKPRPSGPPPLLDDADGERTEPDPVEATTPEEFIRFLRAFWEWAGRHSFRDLAAWSNGGFSHATVHKLLAVAPSKRPPVRLEYVQALIRACGGQDDRVQRWSTAWRRIYVATVASEAATAEVISLHNRAANG